LLRLFGIVASFVRLFGIVVSFVRLLRTTPSVIATLLLIAIIVPISLSVLIETVKVSSPSTKESERVVISNDPELLLI
jgi:hypothetical protein